METDRRSWEDAGSLIRELMTWKQVDNSHRFFSISYLIGHKLRIRLCVDGVITVFDEQNSDYEYMSGDSLIRCLKKATDSLAQPGKDHIDAFIAHLDQITKKEKVP
jgi:hypothetical protein